jgi:hypothetical protein
MRCLPKPSRGPVSLPLFALVWKGKECGLHLLKFCLSTFRELCPHSVFRSSRPAGRLPSTLRALT